MGTRTGQKRWPKIVDTADAQPSMFDVRPLSAATPPASDHEPYDLETGELLGSDDAPGLRVPFADIALTSEPEREPFATWLLEQARMKRGGTIGELAKMAKADPGFPKRGGAEEVRNRIGLAGADGDTFEALDDAEREYERLTPA